MTEADAPWAIRLPTRLDRRMRLGPFPSARDAMKFAAYAAAGTAVLPVGGPGAWLPILAGGFLLSVYRPDGKGIDERVGDFVRYQTRRRPRRSRSAPVGSPGAPARQVDLPGTGLGAVIEVGGVPVRFLPPSEARDLFERYRALLRGLDGPLVLEAGSAPLDAPDRPRPPAEGPESEISRSARAGYEEMVRLLFRRRLRRRVRILVSVAGRSEDASAQLDQRAARMSAHLEGLGLTPIRLSGGSLRRAIGAFGFDPLGGPA